MLKDPQTPRYAQRRTHRTYTPQFKAALVAMCHKPGVSIAAVAQQHGMNANLLHRWRKEWAQGVGAGTAPPRRWRHHCSRNTSVPGLHPHRAEHRSVNDRQ
ncbi:transposase [Hydrogenophaga sp.]|uniref:transposase n=1 Tax=Hydrogenophaga sp. TaxID=1904254 RepID=UPI003F6AA626